MQSSRRQVEREIAKDISLSFWPFPPDNILAVGQETACLGLCAAEEISSCHVKFLGSKSLDSNQSSKRISIISEDWGQVDWGSNYSIVLATEQLRSLSPDSQLSFLSRSKQCLKNDGRVVALEMTEKVDHSSSLCTLQQVGNAAGFYDVIISAIEDTPWSVILFRKQRDFSTY